MCKMFYPNFMYFNQDIQGDKLRLSGHFSNKLTKNHLDFQ